MQIIYIDENKRGAITMDGVPSGYRLPALDEMAYGDLRCDHSCDVEHVQEIDGTDYATSIVWTTDGGCGELPAPMIGCQWIGSIERYADPASWRDPEWETVHEVMLDCDADTPDREAIEVVYNLLRDSIYR
jgi:hypothetical protein